LKFAFKRFSKTIEKGAPEARSFLKPLGFDLTPAEATGSRALDMMEGIVETSFLGGGPLRTEKVLRQGGMEKWAKDFANRFGEALEPARLGQMIKETIQGNFNAAELPAKTLRNYVERAAGNSKWIAGEIAQEGRNIMVPASQLRASVMDLAAQGRRLGHIAADEMGDGFIDDMVRITSPEVTKVAPQAGFKGFRAASTTTSPKLLAFADAVELNTRAQSVMKKIALAKNSPVGAKRIGQISTDIKNVMSQTLKDQAPDLHKLFEESRVIFKGDREVFKNAFVAQLLKTAEEEGLDTGFRKMPETIVAALFSGKGRTSNIKFIKKALGAESDTYKSVQTTFLKELFRKSQTDPTAPLLGTKLLNEMFTTTAETGGVGRPFLNELLGKNLTDELEQFALALAKTKQKSGGPGAFAIMLRQPAAALGAAGAASFGLLGTAPFTGAMAVILAGPWVLAKTFLNPTSRRILIEGAKPGTKTIASVATGIRLANIVRKMQQDGERFQNPRSIRRDE